MKNAISHAMVVSLLAAVAASGCATTSHVDQRVAEVAQQSQAQVAQLEQQLQAAQREIAELKRSGAEQDQRIASASETAREALARAREAGIATTTLLYEVTLTDEAVKFGFDRADLSDEAKAALASFAARLKRDNENVYIEIQGHTDNAGPAAYNKILGKNRAESVLRHLREEHGFPLYRMSVFSYGEEKPIADNDTREGRAQNRRVTLVVMR